MAVGDELRSSGIYLITNKINGKKYVGRSVNVFNRWSSHKSKYGKTGKCLINKQTKIQYDIQKYGADNFDIKILYYFKDEKEYFLESPYYEQLYMCIIEPEYNISFGFGHGCTDGLDIADDDYCVKARTTWNRDLKKFKEHYLCKNDFLQHYDLRASRNRAINERMRI